ncbi:hypothetical protein EB001_15105 [bacterium]|nr:hypothetical protein [bacterium]
MSKEEVIKLMLDSLNADNRELCSKMGMSQEDTETQIEQSQPSLIFMLGNIYEKLKSSNVLA